MLEDLRIHQNAVGEGCISLESAGTHLFEPINRGFVYIDRSGDVPDGFAFREELRRNLNLIRLEIVGSAKADTAPFGCLAAGPVRSRIRSRSNPAIPAKTVVIIVPDVGPRLRE
ncbi:MAG TPA: hypothetical protein VN442_26465 [Bryobacteraceae bacterium]|nr:hypothetical protein [Bryobacteraceae bacterium]